MAIYFGDMVSITCTHNGTSYRFSPKANESFSGDLGGIRNNDDANQVTTDGKMMLQSNRFRGMMEGPVAVEDTTEKTLNLLSKSRLPQSWVFVNSAGRTYSTNDGAIVGDIQTDYNAGTINLKIVCAEFQQLT